MLVLLRTFAVSAVAMAVLAAVFALPATAQELQWENRGQPDFAGGATGIAVKDDIVVASGTTCDQINNCTWYVRAQNRRTGVTLWQDRLRDPVFFDLAKKIAIGGHRAFAAGWVYELATGYEFVVRGYDLDTGVLHWDKRFDHGFGGDTAKVVCVDGNRVFVGGYFNPIAGEFDFTVVAFDVRNGAILWESQTDPSQFAQSSAWDIVAAEGRVYAAGEFLGGMLIRAYDQATGEVLWEHTVPNAHNYAAPNSLAVSHGRVFLAAAQDGTQFMVRAYAAKSGAPLWSDVATDTNRASQAYAVAASEGRLFALGITGCNPVSGVECKLLLRAYDPQTGAILWQAKNQSSGNDWSVYEALTAGDGQVAVGGQSLDTNGHYDGEIRVYDTDTGQFRWRDTFDGGGTTAIDDVGEMILYRRHLYLEAQISRPDNGSDFSVRAYRARLHDGNPE